VAEIPQLKVGQFAGFVLTQALIPSRLSGSSWETGCGGAAFQRAFPRSNLAASGKL